ncbi:MAG: hypothetical protein [Caudoviricetes sp.]|nr:MAG: hypothetical protein [Caudoviricetes sp.]
MRSQRHQRNSLDVRRFITSHHSVQPLQLQPFHFSLFVSIHTVLENLPTVNTASTTLTTEVSVDNPTLFLCIVTQPLTKWCFVVTLQWAEDFTVLVNVLLTNVLQTTHLNLFATNACTSDKLTKLTHRQANNREVNVTGVALKAKLNEVILSIRHAPTCLDVHNYLVNTDLTSHYATPTVRGNHL